METFWKITPGGNPTILMEAEAVPMVLRARAAAEIMDPLHLGGEQVGFIRRTGALPRLDMMGGEFCLNATRAFAALLAREGYWGPPGPEEPETWSGTVEVSGATEPVAVRTRRTLSPVSAREIWTAAARLDLADAPRPTSRTEGALLIRLPGIAHLILENLSPPSPADLPARCADLRTRFHLDNEEAVGCLWLDTHAGPPFLYPVVWVRATQSLCRESACGSGTLACALAMRDRSGGDRFTIRQPGGDALTVTFEPSPGRSVRAWVDGPVRFVAEGRLDVSCL